MTRAALAIACLLFGGLLWAAHSGAGEESPSPSATTTTSSSNNTTTASNGTASSSSNSTTASNSTSEANRTSTASSASSSKPTNTTNITFPTTYTKEFTYSPPPSFSTPYPTSYPVAAPPPIWPTRPNQNYTYGLEGQTVYQDVSIYSAQKVVIRNARIYGNLSIGWSSNILLDRVEVSGTVMIDQSNGIIATALTGRYMVGFSYSENFKLSQSQVGAHLGVFRSAHGALADVGVGGQVVVVDSSDVQQTNVRAAGRAQFGQTLVPPPPTTAVVTFNVSESNLSFSHEKELSARVHVEARLEVDASSGTARLRVPSPANAEKASVEVKSRFEKLVEFEDLDGNGAYDLSDHVLREFPIGALQVKRIEQQRVAQDTWVGRLEYGIVGTGRFVLTFAARDQDADRTKIDVEIVDYAYLSPRSQLALQIRLASASEWELQKAGDEDRIAFGGAGTNGYFGWARTVEADGRARDVTARVLEEHKTAAGEREIVLLLAYPAATHLLHDPSIGLSDIGLGRVVLPEIGDAVVYGTTLVAALTVLWAVGEGRRRAP